MVVVVTLIGIIVVIVVVVIIIIIFCGHVIVQRGFQPGLGWIGGSSASHCAAWFSANAWLGRGHHG